MHRKPLIIVGDSTFAEIAFEYFTHDSEMQPVAFAVEASYRTRSELFGLPVVDLETLTDRYPASEHHFFRRCRLWSDESSADSPIIEMKAKGLFTTSYISSKAFRLEKRESG